ncbi:MAG: hypothetical protein K0R14_1858 [Burkholderiales bacterium]|jgi:hypothetical protein|nr:hypothetical protein [Burkholderiales bacterium]
MQDIWHFPRTELTKKLTNAIRYNIIHSFTLFAPRRIGKTYFLNYDLKPALDELGYKTIYFSFADQIGNHLQQFKNSLASNIDRTIFAKLKVKEISFPWCKVVISQNTPFADLSILELLSILAHEAEKRSSQIVLMLDEIQELIYVDNAEGFVGELRTALDLNKNYVKVIFTGSSRYGLRKMFSDNKAPFFHFGTSLKMEPFGREFTDFLAKTYHSITGKHIDEEQFYQIFSKLNFVTLSIREFLSFYMMCQDISLEDAYKGFEAEIFDKNGYVSYWNSLIQAEKILLLGLVNNFQNFYSEKFYDFVFHNYHIEITQGRVQNALNKLLKQGDIHENDNGEYEIEDLFMKRWLESRKDEPGIV